MWISIALVGSDCNGESKIPADSKPLPFFASFAYFAPRSYGTHTGPEWDDWLLTTLGRLLSQSEQDVVGGLKGPA